MLSDEKLDEIIAIFEHMREKPHLAMIDADPTIITYLGGFMLACRIFEIEDMFDGAFSLAEINHGWRPSAIGVHGQMQKKGMTDDEITRESIDIFVEALQIIKKKRTDNEE